MFDTCVGEVLAEMENFTVTVLWTKRSSPFLKYSNMEGQAQLLHILSLRKNKAFLVVVLWECETCAVEDGGSLWHFFGGSLVILSQHSEDCSSLVQFLQCNT